MAENKQPEIVFPHEWEYRVFCECTKYDAAMAKISGMALDGAQLTPGAASKSGTYKSLRFTFIAGSKEYAEKIGGELKNIDGVKFIL